MRIFRDRYKEILDSLNDSIRNPKKESISYLKVDVLHEIKKVKGHQHRKRLIAIREVAINKLLMEKHK